MHGQVSTCSSSEEDYDPHSGPEARKGRGRKRAGLHSRSWSCRCSAGSHTINKCTRELGSCLFTQPAYLLKCTAADTAQQILAPVEGPDTGANVQTWMIVSVAHGQLCPYNQHSALAREKLAADPREQRKPSQSGKPMGLKPAGAQRLNTARIEACQGTAT